MASKRIWHQNKLIKKSKNKIARQMNAKINKQPSHNIEIKITTAGITIRKIIIIIQLLRKMSSTKIAGKQYKRCKISRNYIKNLSSCRTGIQYS
jgi:hypothetical protein